MRKFVSTEVNDTFSWPNHLKQVKCMVLLRPYAQENGFFFSICCPNAETEGESQVLMRLIS